MEIPGTIREDFEPEIMIYRAINSGMVSMAEVKRGEVTLRDIVRICAYLDIKNDIELKQQQKASRERG